MKRLSHRSDKLITGLLLTSLLALTLSACAGDLPLLPGQQGKTQMRVLFAGSLILPFDDLERAFEEAHPDVDVLMEGHGSIQCIRHVTELEELADVVAVADYALIPLLMYETDVPDTGDPYADWTMRFATNQLGLAYTDESAYADEINATNWYEILSRPDVLFGLSDPRFDACGYRGMMVGQLATSYYDEPDLFYNLFGDRFTKPVRVQESEDAEQPDTILIPEVLQPEEDSGLTMRGASVQLLGLLESGDLDYAFEYQSVSRQHDLNFLTLPPEINLSDSTCEEAYNRVRVKLAFQRFATVNPEFEGKTIAYGLTIPSNAPHPDLAAELIQFLIGPDGQRVMAENEHPMILPTEVDNHAALPEGLKP
jgi:molybdate/tungstate transport system substrate-binding protein